MQEYYMIQNKKTLKAYLQADFSRYHLRKNALIYYLFGDESFAVLRFLKRLRKTEYYYNTLNKRNPFSLVRFGLSFVLYRRMQLRYKLFIPLNVVGPGIYIPHRMGGGNYQCSESRPKFHNKYRMYHREEE